MDYNVSIRAVIDVIEDFPHGDVWNVESMEEMIDRIKQLPSAQPKHGKWICTGEPDESWGMMYECSICGNHDYGGNYCSYCGAKMEDSEDERPDRQTTGD